MKVTQMGKKKLSIQTPPSSAPLYFNTSADALDHATALYTVATGFLAQQLSSVDADVEPTERFRAFYPEIRIKTTTFAQIDSRLSYGHVMRPGVYAATITRPDLFREYLTEQLDLLIENHDIDVSVGLSETPIPIHFAMQAVQSGPVDLPMEFPLRDVFDVPDLATTNDDIINGVTSSDADDFFPLAPFTAQRIDYSLARLEHYTATRVEHFQQHVLFTNYQFYIDEFEGYAREMLADETSGYTSFVATGNQEITDAAGEISVPAKLPQMPTYHLKRADGGGITLVNIGVGPSNAKTATDHIAVLRPHAWLMVGHCAGLRNSQSLGDFVLAHAYVREDHVLDDDLPNWVPIPPLAEVQIALEAAVGDITALKGFELKSILRTGTVASVDNRNWELRESSGPIKRLSMTRAIALDMESAAIAANGFRFRVPYGTLLCVSDKPLHGELKLPGMASDFYNTQVARHLKIGIRTMEILREMPLERLHSRKLRSFEETAFR
jgi:AMP nucleosidase